MFQKGCRSTQTPQLLFFQPLVRGEQVVRLAGVVLGSGFGIMLVVVATKQLAAAAVRK